MVAQLKTLPAGKKKEKKSTEPESQWYYVSTVSHCRHSNRLLPCPIANQDPPFGLCRSGLMHGNGNSLPSAQVAETGDAARVGSFPIASQHPARRFLYIDGQIVSALSRCSHLLPEGKRNLILTPSGVRVIFFYKVTQQCPPGRCTCPCVRMMSRPMRTPGPSAVIGSNLPNVGIRAAVDNHELERDKAQLAKELRKVSLV